MDNSEQVNGSSQPESAAYHEQYKGLRLGSFTDRKLVSCRAMDSIQVCEANLMLMTSAMPLPTTCI